MPVRAVVFDAFGTIIHPEPGWEALRAECLTIVHGSWTGPAVPLPAFLAAYERVRAAQHAALGESLQEFDFAERFAMAMVRCGAPQAEAFAWGPVASEKYHRFQQALVHPYDQPWKPLRTLKAWGYQLALLSNYNHGGVLRDALHRLDLLSAFDVVLVSGELGHMKPHERVYRAALEALGTRPEETVMVGNDLECDVVGARRHGLRTVWTPYPRRRPVPACPEADAVVGSLAEVPDVVAKL